MNNDFEFGFLVAPIRKGNESLFPLNYYEVFCWRTRVFPPYLSFSS